MDRPRVMPLVAGVVVAVSLTACQGTMGDKESGQQQSSQANPPATSAGQQAMSSDLVRDVQRGLSSRGYDVGPQDGIYGDSTEQALRRFQRDQKLTASGQVDSQTLAALGIPSNTLATTSRSGTSSSRDYVPTSRRQGASATQSSTPRVGLNQDQVRGVQQNLASRGYDTGQVDGRWGPRTQQALRDFQRDQNMQANGRPDAQTLAALGVESGSPATQTGQLPAENPPPAAPQQSEVPNPPAPDIQREAPPPAVSPAPVPAPQQNPNPPD